MASARVSGGKGLSSTEELIDPKYQPQPSRSASASGYVKSYSD
jgi:hypothetical protein